MLSVLVALATSPLALANGQTSHVWITFEALERLPAGDLRDLLTRDDLRDDLMRGAMFPDGGYAIGDDYGELAHWETIQEPYLAWIHDRFDAPWTDEAAHHIAFLMGMASHGMADQTYDSLYIERARVFDAASDWGLYSADEATDVAFSAATGAAYVAPPTEYPEDPLIELFLTAGNHEVSPGTVETGTAMLAIALAYVAAAAEQPDTVAMYADRFPWATAHQLDADIGAPPTEADVVALYWQALWERLHDMPASDPVIWTLPADGGYGQPAGTTDVEAWVTVVFRRGLDDDRLTPEDFEVVDGSGNPVAITTDLYYRNTSHVVHLKPVDGWAPDADYLVHVLAGAETFDGEALDGTHTFGFSTRPPPDPVVADEPDDGASEGCGCVHGSSPSPWLAGFAAAVLATRRRRAAVGTLLLAAWPAGAQEVQSQAFHPRPVAGHPVFDLRVGADRVDLQHPFLCAEVSPLPWVSVEGCGNGSGFLHQGDEPDMAHFRGRVRPIGYAHGRTDVDLLVGAGFAEVQRTADQPGFRFGKATDPDPIEAAGPELSVGTKGRLWIDNGGRTYVSGDFTVGGAYIPAAPDVIGRGSALVPFGALTFGLGF